MSFLWNWSARDTVPSFLQHGWEEHIVDGNKIYLNTITKQYSMTLPTPEPAPPEAKLLPGWNLKTNPKGKIFYLGPLTVEGKTKMCQQDVPLTKFPNHIRLSSKWKLFFTNKSTLKRDESEVNIYENIETHEKTHNFPLAYGDDLLNILTNEVKIPRNRTPAEIEDDRNIEFRHWMEKHGGRKNKSKQSKRKNK